MPAVNSVTPSGDLSGATDTANINAALSNTDPDVVAELAPGHFFTNAPLVPGSGNALAGHGGGVNGSTATNPHGSVIHPVAAHAGPEVVTLPPDARGIRLLDFAILNDLSTTATVHGIAARGSVGGTLMERLSVGLVNGHGIAFIQVNGSDGDGLKMRTVMIQRPGLNGVHRPVSDANIHDVHIQYAGMAGDATYKHGFYSTPGSSGNMSYVGCRADLCVGSGWVIDRQGAFGDATKLTGCSTERNGESGVLVDNSSATGGDWRNPVVIAGCCFEGDGTGVGPTGPPGPGGNFGAIEVRGRNSVFINGTTSMVNTTDVTAGCPKYALILRQAGSASTQPETVEWGTGYLNYSSGQSGAAILNHSLCDQLQLGLSLTQDGGYQPSTPSPRSGTATLSSGTATVSTPWAWPSMLVVLTPLASPAGRLYVSSRATGSFVIKSTSATDTGLAVAWAIVPD